MLRRKCGGSAPMEFSEDDFGDNNSSQGGNVSVLRNAANARERARMRVLSSAFGCLKTKLPNIPPDTKLSKLDTLRLATIYIKQLKTIVDAYDFTPNEPIMNDNNSPRKCCINLPNGTTTNVSCLYELYHHHYQPRLQRNQNGISILSLPTWSYGHSNSTSKIVEQNSIAAAPKHCIGDCKMKYSISHFPKDCNNNQNSLCVTPRRDPSIQLKSEYYSKSNQHTNHHYQYEHSNNQNNRHV